MLIQSQNYPRPVADADRLPVDPHPRNGGRRVPPGAAVEHDAHSLFGQRVGAALVIQDVGRDWKEGGLRRERNEPLRSSH